jgi:energy-coupling factor transporter ATP-binding protein EcfA2
MAPTVTDPLLEGMGMDAVPEDYGTWLIHGPQGSGKSTLAATIATVGLTLFIDLTGEHGVRSFRGAPGAQNIKVLRPASITALDDIFWALAKGDHPYKAVVLDSLTSTQKMAMRFMLGHDETAVREIRRGTAPADQRTWGQTLDIMTDTATFWFGLADAQREHPLHVVMTAQTKITESEDTGQTTRVPDVQKGSLSTVLACPDYVVYTDFEDNPAYMADSDDEPPVKHIVRFGSNISYRIKARVPVDVRGKIPPILGRKNPTSLVTLSRILGVGGIPQAAKRAAAAPASKES